MKSIKPLLHFTAAIGGVLDSDSRWCLARVPRRFGMNRRIPLGRSNVIVSWFPRSFPSALCARVSRSTLTSRLEGRHNPTGSTVLAGKSFHGCWSTARSPGAGLAGCLSGFDGRGDSRLCEREFPTRCRCAAARTVECGRACAVQMDVELGRPRPGRLQRWSRRLRTSGCAPALRFTSSRSAGPGQPRGSVEVATRTQYCTCRRSCQMSASRPASSSATM